MVATKMQPRWFATCLPMVASCLVANCLVAGCQDYSFDFRANERIEAQRLNQLVATLTPVDILFVIDNSPTMREETDELKNNVERFVTDLAAEKIDFQIGIVTPDVECNLPSRLCTGGAGSFSNSCCALKTGQAACTDKDNNGDFTIETSDCEAGRLQGAGASGQRIFSPPAEADRQQWVTDFVSAIDFALHGLKGSAFESGIQAATMAVACAVGSPDCNDAETGSSAAARALNNGFIREGADLVIIFLTDEDDCSTGDRSIYLRPDNPNGTLDQAAHFCSPDECYAYYNEGSDADNDGLDDWSDPSGPLPASRRLRCGNTGTIDRVVNPPGLRDVGPFLDKLVAYKGSLRAVRAAGIISAVQRAENAAYEGSACFTADAGPSAVCGCVAGANDFSCDITSANGQGSQRLPQRSETSGGPVSPTVSGCTAAPGNRYVRFLDELGSRRVAQGFSRDTLVDSICRIRYDATLDAIVNNVIIPRCFTLSQTPANASYLSVSLNGATLANVPVGSTKQGWSLADNARQICLEGGLRKQVGDRFEILQVTATQ